MSQNIVKRLLRLSSWVFFFNFKMMALYQCNYTIELYKALLHDPSMFGRIYITGKVDVHGIIYI